MIYCSLLLSNAAHFQAIQHLNNKSSYQIIDCWVSISQDSSSTVISFVLQLFLFVDYKILAEGLVYNWNFLFSLSILLTNILTSPSRWLWRGECYVLLWLERRNVHYRWLWFRFHRSSYSRFLLPVFSPIFLLTRWLLHPHKTKGKGEACSFKFKNSSFNWWEYCKLNHLRSLWCKYCETLIKWPSNKKGKVPTLFPPSDQPTTYHFRCTDSYLHFPPCMFISSVRRIHRLIEIIIAHCL